MRTILVSVATLIGLLLSLSAGAADLVRGVRNKLSAADLASGIAAVEDYRATTGVDAEYLNAVGWLARGAMMLGRPELAAQYAAELRREIPEEREDLTIPFGAAVEVEAKLRHAQQGRGAALEFLAVELARAKDTALRSRIQKNINLLSLEGQAAPLLENGDGVAQSFDGKPTLLFLWANWCGDCKAQQPVLARLWELYRGKGLQIIAPTRLYGTVDEKPATAAEEKERIAKAWKESYPGLEQVPVTVDTGTMIRYGASATPTFVLIDRQGIVRLYAPTRLPEAELMRRIDAVLRQ